MNSKQLKAQDKREEKRMLTIEGYPIEGISIGGHETCIIFPSLNLAFDIGRCPQRAISQDFLFISHAHMDHIGGLPIYVATRGLYRMKPPTIVLPTSIKETVEQLFEVHRKLDGSELNHNLVGLDVGEEFYMRKDLKVKAFRTYHAIQSQGYVVYSIKQKLKLEFLGLPPNEIKNLKASGIEITNTITIPEVAFTGDTMSDFITDETNVDALRARILVMEVYGFFCASRGAANIVNAEPLSKSWDIGESNGQMKYKNKEVSTFIDDTVKVEHARDYGHTHLSEVVSHADRFKNKAILLIHFSARYTVEEIQEVVSRLPTPLAGRVFALTDGF